MFRYCSTIPKLHIQVHYSNHKNLLGNIITLLVTCTCNQVFDVYGCTCISSFTDMMVHVYVILFST